MDHNPDTSRRLTGEQKIQLIDSMRNKGSYEAARERLTATARIIADRVSAAIPGQTWKFDDDPNIQQSDRNGALCDKLTADIARRPIANSVMFGATFSAEDFKIAANIVREEAAKYGATTESSLFNESAKRDYDVQGNVDALAAHRRAHGLPAISLGWGLWDQASAMTGGLATVDFKRFARDGIVAMSSADALQLFDTAMIVDEPFMLPAHIDFAALKVKFDGGTLPPMFVDLINAPTRRQVDDSLAAAKSKSALLQRLEGLPEDEQHAVLLDLVRSHIATVLGSASPEAIDPDRAFQELGFDSLTAVEMRNRLKSATGLALSPTLIFDYPNSAALAGYMRRELLGSSPQDTSAVAAGEAELQRIVASIPVKRLRQAGVLDLLLALANETETSGQDPALAPTAEQEIADMDLDDLVNAAFRNDDE